VNDDQIRAIADLALANNEIIVDVSSALNNLIEQVLPLLPADAPMRQNATRLLSSIEHAEAAAKDSERLRNQLRQYLGMKP
jgi:hypothetical protein